MFYIRTDANQILASGHVMRCLTIALELRKQGEETTFIIADSSTQIFIETYHFPIIQLNSLWGNLDTETIELIEIIHKHNIEKLLIDSYCVTFKYFENLSECTKVIYLGSLEKKFSIDLLINYSNTLNMNFYLEEPHFNQTKLLLGPKYSPLREEFKNITPIVRDRVSHILVSTGGTDPENIAGKLVEYLMTNSQIQNIGIHIIVGNMNKNVSFLENLEFIYSNVYLHHRVSNISALMQSCDLAISAAGTTLYELCTCAVPTICFSMVKEQAASAAAFEKQNVLLYAGDTQKNLQRCFENVKMNLENLVGDYEMRKRASERMRNFVDGKGSERIATAILEL